VVSLFIAAALLKQAGWAKWLVLMGALLGAGQWTFVFVLSGHWLAVVAALSSLCVLGAFWFETPRQRLAATAAGVVLALGWFGLLQSAVDDAGGGLSAYALPGGTYSDPVAGLTVVAPAGLVLYDLQRLRAEQAGGSRGGVLGLLAREGVSLEGAGQAACWPWATQARPPRRSRVGRCPRRCPPIPPADAPGRAGRGPSAWTSSSRCSCGGPRWRRRPGATPPAGLLLLRAADGRTATVVCAVRQRAAERLCARLFAGVSLRP
jgi:hypothetical protein